MAYLTFDPAEKQDFTFDWADELGANTISSSSWSVSPSGPTLSNPSDTDTTATTYITGGTVGKIYSLDNVITTNVGTILKQTVTLRCATK